MTWIDWIPALSTSTLVAIIGIAFNIWYKAEVEKRVQHRFDGKLEELKSKIRQDEEEFRASLNRKDQELAAIRSGALSGLVSRNSALDKRRLEAAERLWSATVELARLKMLSATTRIIKMDAALDAAANEDEDGRKMRQVAETYWKMFGLDDLKSRETPDKERPFVSPAAWAHFSAYRMVLLRPVAQFAAMRTGVGRKMIADPADLLSAVKSVLPQYQQYIDQYGEASLPHLVEDLENALLARIVESLVEEGVDQKFVERAAKITGAANRATQESDAILESAAKVGIPSSLRSDDGARQR